VYYPEACINEFIKETQNLFDQADDSKAQQGEKPECANAHEDFEPCCNAARAASAIKFAIH
jgi:hypothetical protein